MRPLVSVHGVRCAPGDLPEPPYTNCTSETGCRCIASGGKSVTPGAKPYIFNYPRFPTADVCQTPTEMPIVTSFPNTKVLGHGHDHPSEPNQTVTCNDDSGNIKVDKNGTPIPVTTVDGADQTDWDWTNDVNDPTKNPQYAAKGWLPMPGFIIDKHNVFTTRPGQSLGDEQNSGNKFPSGNGRCKWPRR
jgi:hypothetical protein